MRTSSVAALVLTTACNMEPADHTAFDSLGKVSKGLVSEDALTASASYDINAYSSDQSLYVISYWVAVTTAAADTSIVVTLNCLDNFGNNSASAASPTQQPLDASNTGSGQGSWTIQHGQYQQCDFDTDVFGPAVGLEYSYRMGARQVTD